ncbi:MAG: Golgi Transport [Cyphobasidiales sp. Tagirdzhanova-0007]|nr:MAG: Golgi Transport [Cyphobasidiales sp. Tagirdzhanova-0007]
MAYSENYFEASSDIKIGVGVTSFGLVFLFLGVVTFFDAALLALGDILFLAGITLVIGPRKTVAFFARRNKLRGTACFMGGIVLVFLRYPFWGMLIEAFGFLNLFGDFFPVIITFLRQLPFVGNILSLPGVRQVMDRIAGVGARRTPV